VTRRAAVISNPRSERNRTEGILAPSRLAERAVLHDFRDLPGILERLRASGVELIVVDGGDGTVQAVITELMASRSAERWQPKLAVLASGMTNLIAADVGVARRGAASVDRLLGGRETLRRRTVRLDLVDAASGKPHRSLWGMFFGAAVLHRGAELARDEVHARGIKHAAGVALTIGTIAWRSLLRQQDDFFLGDEIELRVDGGPADRRRRFLFMATTLERLVLGLWPFWGQGGGALRYLDVPGPPPRLLSSLARVLMRRPSAAMARAGYRSGSAETLSLSLAAACVLDGELVQPGPHERISLSVGPAVEFVRA
jgi:hypothetical protein